MPPNLWTSRSRVSLRRACFLEPASCHHKARWTCVWSLLEFNYNNLRQNGSSKNNIDADEDVHAANKQITDFDCAELCVAPRCRTQLCSCSGDGTMLTFQIKTRRENPCYILIRMIVFRGHICGALRSQSEELRFARRRRLEMSKISQPPAVPQAVARRATNIEEGSSLNHI